MAELTEEEILKGGKVVSGTGVKKDAAAPDAPAVLSEADVVSGGKQVKGAGIAPTPKEGTAPTSFGDQLLRQGGLAVRAAGPYAGTALAGGGLGYALGGPLLAPVGAVAGPAAMALTDLGTTAYNAVGSMVGAPAVPSATDIFDMLLDKAGVPRPETPGERISQSVVRAASPTAATAKTADALSKVVSNPTTAGVLKGMGANPTAQTISGGVAGGTTQTGIELGLNPIVATLLGMVTGIGTNVAGQRVGNAQSGKLTPEGQRAMDLNAAAKKEGVTLSAGDLGNRTAATIENFLQDVPFSGRDAFMQQQAQQTKTMLERLQASLPKGEPGKDMIAAIKSAYDAKRATASKLYDAVDTELAKVPGSNQIPTTNFNKQASQFLKEYPKYLESPDVPQSVKDVLSHAASGQSVVAPYQTVRELRTMIGTEIKAAQRAGKPISGELSQLYKSLSRDVDDWSTKLASPNSPYANPAAAKAFGQADTFFKQNVVPFKNDPKIRKVVASTTSQDELDIAADSIMGTLFKPGNANKADYALKLTGKPGETIAQTELVQRGLTPGLDPTLKAGVSPMRFVNSLDVNDPMVANVLNRNGPFADQVRNIANVAQATRRSVTAFETPRTGVQNKAVATGIGLVNPVTTLPTAAGLGAAQLTQRALRSDPVKSLLFSQGADPMSSLLPILNAINNTR